MRKYSPDTIRHFSLMLFDNLYVLVLWNKMLLPNKKSYHKQRLYNKSFSKAPFDRDFLLLHVDNFLTHKTVFSCALVFDGKDRSIML